MSSTYTSSSTYTVADIEQVASRFTTDLLMIADSTKALAQDEARRYSRDVERLMKKAYLAKVDVTLLDFLGQEVKAVTYHVDTEAGSLTNNRPGGVLWPQTTGGSVRVILFYNSTYDDGARQKMRESLEIPWGPTSVDTSHTTLRAGAGRDYQSNGFGLQRKDFTK